MKSPAHQSLFSPVQLITAGLIVTMGLLLITGYQSWGAYKHSVDIIRADAALRRNLQVINSSPQLTALTTAAAESGSADLLTPYLELCERVNESIEQVISAVPNSQFAVDGRALQEVNNQLVDIERQSFDLVAAGRLTEAGDLLESDRYKILLAQCDMYNSSLNFSANGVLEETLRHQKSHASVVLMSCLVATALMLAIWLYVLTTVKKYLRQCNSLETELRTLSFRDDMTGLLNRRGFSEAIDLVNRAKDSTGERMLLMFCDVDQMKSINDMFGHAAGDRAIVEAGRILRSCVRETDVVARIGGDEFVVLTSEGEHIQRHILEDRITASLAAFNARTHEPYTLSLSIGTVSYSPDMGESVEKILELADRKMYEVKHGRKTPTPLPARRGEEVLRSS